MSKALAVLCNYDILGQIIGFQGGRPGFIVQFFKETDCQRWGLLMEQAFKYGNWRVANWIYEHDRCSFCPSRFYYSDECESLVYCRLDTLQWILSNIPAEKWTWLWDYYLDASIRFENIEMIQLILHQRRQYLTSNKFYWSAAVKGNIEVFKFLYEFQPRLPFLRSESNFVLGFAVASGLLDIIQYMHDQNIGTCDTAAMNLAAEKGHIAVLKLMYSCRSERCSIKAISKAARNGHLNVLIFLINQFPREDVLASWTSIKYQAELGGYQYILYYLDAVNLESKLYTA